jgi:RHS repeat-associated protein
LPIALPRATRDQRIESIVLPDGERIEYAFTAAGDLDYMRDAVEQLTRFTYKAGFPHYLEEIFDPRGVRAIRNEYDDEGRLSATIDADGHRIEYTHDIEGRTEQIRDRRQHLLTYVYDEEGRVLSESNHLGETIQHQYDADGNEVLRIDPLLNRTTWTHDARGNVLTETNAENETTTREYDSRNNLLVEYDAAHVPVIRNQYRPNTTLLTSMTDALDQVTGFGYDIGIDTGNTGELNRMRDAGDGWTTFEIDHRGWRVAETDALGHVTSYTHDALGRVLTETTTRTQADGSIETLVTSYTYDDKGRLIRTTYPDASFSTTEYNVIDKPERECDVLNRCTVTQYDDRGNVERIDYPDGTFETKAYDPNGNLIEERDRAGRTTRHRYDAADRLVETIHPDATPEDDTDNPRSRSEYDAAGRLTVSIDARGARTRYGYDDAGRRTTVTDALEHTSTTVYDSRGRRERVIDALNRVTRFVYDEAGRLIETVHPDAHVPSGDDGNEANNPRSRTDYDALGRKIAQTDELGRSTRYAYDKLGRLIAVALPNADTGANPPLIQTGSEVSSPDTGVAITRYRYDERGNKIAQIDALGRTTQWEYDAMGRETARVLPMGQRETFAYDALGNREHHVDFNGLETHYEYDSVNRLTRIDHPDQPDVLISYTASGQRESVSDAHGITVYDYDAQDRLIRIDSPDGRWIEYAYDAVGNRIELRTQNQQIDYGFDDLNRLASVRREGETAAVTYTYDAVGNRDELSHPNGTRSVYRYDARNRLSQLSQIGLGGVLLLGMSYEVDAIGLRQSIAEQHADGRSRVSTYQYDAQRRLIDERINDSLAGTLGHHWTYDAVGNRLSQVTDGNGIQTTRGYQLDANDRLLEVTENGQSIESYTYDNAGNTRTRTDLSGLTEYAWNSEGRLIEQRSATATVQFGYNSDGIRIHSQILGGTRTEYLIDPNQAYAQVIEEHQGQLRTDYLHGDDLLAQIRSVESLPGDPPAEDLRWFHYDGLGSTRLLSDATGIPTDHYAYTAFGELIEQASQTPTDNPYRYTGEQWDQVLGMYYLRARYMEPGSGRFWGMDAWAGDMGNPLSLNKYAYVVADPINLIDPSGNSPLVEREHVDSISHRLRLSSVSTVRVNLRTVAANDANYATSASTGQTQLPSATPVMR